MVRELASPCSILIYLLTVPKGARGVSTLCGARNAGGRENGVGLSLGYWLEATAANQNFGNMRIGWRGMIREYKVRY